MNQLIWRVANDIPSGTGVSLQVIGGILHVSLGESQREYTFVPFPSKSLASAQALCARYRQPTALEVAEKIVTRASRFTFPA
jgi:hypothetical protein